MFESKQEFCFPWQAIVYTSVVHFIFPYARRNLVPDLKQVKRGICKHLESPGLTEGSVTASKSSLCLRLVSKTVSYPGRSECWVCFGCTVKTKSLAFVRPMCSPQKIVDHPHGINPASQKCTSDWRGLFCRSGFFHLYRCCPTALKSLCLRQLYFGCRKDKKQWWQNTDLIVGQAHGHDRCSLIPWPELLLMITKDLVAGRGLLGSGIWDHIFIDDLDPE